VRSLTASRVDAPATESFEIRDEIETPALVVDLDVVLRNLREMAGLCRAAGVELCPHAKTHRTVEYGRLQIAEGASGLTVARLEEAEAFAAGGIGRIIVAYPLIGPGKLRRASALAGRAALTLAADSLDGARALSEHFAGLGQTAGVFLIVDSGQGRDGVVPADAGPLGREIGALGGIRLRGVMTHEGHTYEAAGPQDLIGRSHAAARAAVSAAEAIRAHGQPVETVSMGCSASARLVAGEPGITQVRPGIFTFNDLGQISLGNATPATCAVRVLATVVSHAAPDRAIIDAGSKSLSHDTAAGHGAERFPGFGRLADLPGWRLHELSEEHGWLHWVDDGPPRPLSVGQRVQIMPNHVCTAFWNMGESVGLRDGSVIARWRTIERSVQPLRPVARAEPGPRSSSAASCAGRVTRRSTARTRGGAGAAGSGRSRWRACSPARSRSGPG
jgi:D-serine deaminase-like pyridoxal phosphate-dependent protein